MRRVVVIIAVVCGSALAVMEFLNFSGFCYPKRRYFSDAELIESAIKNNLARHSPQLDSSRQKMYASIEDFHAQNQNCCEINRWIDRLFGAPLLLRLFGVYDALVSIDYRINDAGGLDNFYSSMSAVDACGKVFGVRGMPSADDPNKLKRAVPQNSRSPH